MPEQKVRWGILSTAKIGVEKVIPAMQRGRSGTVAAIASRNRAVAQSVADRLGIPRAYGSYEELLADPEIDAVYNPLPNHLHVPLSIQALEAGKHVLCEKPVALTSQEAEQLVAAGQAHPQLKLMEAFMYRHHPQWVRARELAQSGELGEFRTIQSFFSYFNDDSGNIRNRPEMGGGGLMDIGCYNISLSRFLFGEEPSRIFGCLELDPQFEIDRIASAMLEFSGGKTSTFTCSTQLVPYQRVHIFGTTGRVEIEIPFNAPPDRPCRIWIQRGNDITEEQLPVTDQYTVQGELFARAILENKAVPTPIEDAVANMRVIEAIRRSSQEQRAVTL